ncbi:hypothetical protein FVE85_6930 [Porphyridium purpureum]|uniref:Uncharacterized protein n=1 Tax=Porphyridium purpureum TaxID=35688 RepID=A0A5J4Z7M6_PORPP|nr:hypothetical protein FVE85_6930 [Porphyridium purpureum]|eukprot:POR7054..scf295_1
MANMAFQALLPWRPASSRRAVGQRARPLDLRRCCVMQFRFDSGHWDFKTLDEATQQSLRSWMQPPLLLAPVSPSSSSASAATHAHPKPNPAECKQRNANRVCIRSMKGAVLVGEYINASDREKNQTAWVRPLLLMKEPTRQQRVVRSKEDAERARIDESEPEGAQFTELRGCADLFVPAALLQPLSGELGTVVELMLSAHFPNWQTLDEQIEAGSRAIWSVLEDALAEAFPQVIRPVDADGKESETDGDDFSCHI